MLQTVFLKHIEGWSYSHKRTTSPCVTLRRVSLSTGKANKIGIRIGANGGYVESGNAMGSGMQGEPLSKYSFNPGDGHIAIAQF